MGGTISFDLSSLHLFSNSVFHGNSAIGGAIHIDRNSQIHLYNDTVTVFEYSHAQMGGAIFVNDYVNVKTCYAETRCFFESNTFLFESYDIDRRNFRSQLFFYDNFARTRSDLFGGLLDRCKIHAYGLLNNDREYIGRYIWFLLSNSTQFHVSSFPVRRCFALRIPTIAQLNYQYYQEYKGS